MLASSLHAQYLDSNNIPVVVRKKLHAQYPMANQIKWVKDCYSKDVTEGNKTVQRNLCIRADFILNGGYGEMYLDSTADIIYEFFPLSESELPISVPGNVKEKIASQFPAAKNIRWTHGEQKYVSANCYYQAFIGDTMKGYDEYFDSSWHFLGSRITIYEDSTLIPVQAIKVYIKENIKQSSFESAEIIKDANGNTKLLIVLMRVNKKKYNRYRLKFDSNGKLTEQPEKLMIREGL